MNEVVKRLRHQKDNFACLRLEAVAEIERLEAENERLRIWLEPFLQLAKDAGAIT